MTKDPQTASEALLHAEQLRNALWSLKTVRQHTEFSSATIYRKVAQGTFPQPIRFGKKCTRWKAADIAAWMAALGETA